MHGQDPVLLSDWERCGTLVLLGAGLWMCREGQGSAAGEKRRFMASRE